MNRPPISPTPVTCSPNSQAPTNLAAVSPAPETDFTTIENDNSHSNDHHNSLAGEEEDQGTNSNVTLGAPGNSGETTDEDTLISNNNKSETGPAKDSIFDDEDNDEQLMPQSEKAKWVLADDPLEAMELYFESLGLQDMAQFYRIKNMGSLKQHRDFKRRYPIEAAGKIQKTRKIFAEQLGIGEHLTKKQWYWAMGLDDIPEPPEWPVESWPLVRPFWHKNDLGARLDAWAKYDPLLLNESNPLRDSTSLGLLETP